jgi:hypothetical protein
MRRCARWARLGPPVTTTMGTRSAKLPATPFNAERPPTQYVTQSAPTPLTRA